MRGVHHHLWFLRHEWNSCPSQNPCPVLRLGEKKSASLRMTTVYCLRDTPDETLLTLCERGKWGTVLAIFGVERRFWLKTCAIITLVFLAGCTSSRPVNVKPVTMGIFEVV